MTTNPRQIKSSGGGGGTTIVSSDVVPTMNVTANQSFTAPNITLQTGSTFTNDGTMVTEALTTTGATLDNTGGMVKSSDMHLSLANSRTVYIDGVANLPNPATSSGNIFVVKSSLVQRYSTESFVWQGQNIASNLQLNEGDVLTLKSNGTNWIVLSYTGLGQDNFLINGAMDFWQRATSIAPGSSGQYTADRWYCNDIGSATTVTKETVVLPDTTVDTALKFAVSGGPNYANCEQPIEYKNILPLCGKVVTCSVTIRANIPSFFNLSAYWSNSSDTRSGLATQLATKQIYPVDGTNYYTYTLTFTIPTTAKGLSIKIETPSALGNGHYYYLTKTMLNIGALPAPFIRAGKNVEQELALCQRYFEKSYEIDTAVGTATGVGSYGVPVIFTATGTTSYIAGSTPFKVTKRVAPTAASTALYDDSGNGGWGATAARCYRSTLGGGPNNNANQQCQTNGLSQTGIVFLSTGTTSANSILVQWAVNVEL